MTGAAKIAAPISGGKLYQERARKALPLLVRQAWASKPIFYSDLAVELEMPNPRNLDYPLGSIGRTIERLSKAWKEKIPPIQCLVINKHKYLPGEGIGWFLMKDRDFSSLTPSQKRRVVEAELARIFSYPRWPDVLRALSLPAPKSNLKDIVEAATNWRGGPESEDHIKLKNYIAANPQLLDLPRNTEHGLTEYRIASGDALDVSFDCRHVWCAAEVKSARSKIPDITRGLFQCVKYRAVMQAMQVAKGQMKPARAVLVLEASLPRELVSLKNMLGVEVLDNIKP